MLRAPAATLVEAEPVRAQISEFNGKVIHHTAAIGNNVRLGRNVRVGAFAVIDEETSIGNDTVIGAYAYIGPMVTVGEGCMLHPHVTIRDQVRIGNNVTINCGSIIGSDGFGFANNSGVNFKIPQLGTVEIEDDAWIGSNATIDRATIGATRIRRGARIDNLAQIGHNVEIGEDTVLRPQVGVAGSTFDSAWTLGKGSLKMLGTAGKGLFTTLKGAATANLEELGDGLHATTVGTVSSGAEAVWDTGGTLVNGTMDAGKPGLGTEQEAQWKAEARKRWENNWAEARKELAAMPFPES